MLWNILVDPTSLLQFPFKASFKGSLSYPVLSPDHMIGSHTESMLRNKYDKTFIPNNMVLVGTGISHDALVELGASVEIGRQGKRPVQSNFAMERVIDKNLVSSAKHIRNVIDLSHLVHVTKTIPLFPVGKLDAVNQFFLSFFLNLNAN